jgi:uncharacterized protein
VSAHYLDASARVKRYLDEAGADWVTGLFAQQTAFACASIGFFEVLATLARKLKARNIDKKQFADGLAQLELDWLRFSEVGLAAAVRRIAIDVAQRHALRGADTVHLASAILLRQRLVGDEVLFVAADEELKAAALAEGFTVLDPIVEELRASGDLSNR